MNGSIRVGLTVVPSPHLNNASYGSTSQQLGMNEDEDEDEDEEDEEEEEE